MKPTILSLLLPAYREAENLAWLLPELKAALEHITESYEILVMDAEQPLDATPEVCAANDVECIARIGGRLYGDAVRTGIRHARGRFILVMDADGSHDPSFISRLWERRADAEVVIASRYAEGGSTENPAVLIAMSRCVNVVFQIVLRLPVRDVSNSFRLYDGDSLRSIDLECSNFDIVEEVLVKLVAGPCQARVLEVPATFARRRHGETKRDLLAFAASYLATLRRLHRFRQQALREIRGNS